MKFLQVILLPFAMVYAFAVAVRNKLFDWKVLRSTKFDIPVISVGNLNTGGTGKTPHVEYLVRLLKTNHYVAILSRGYRRKSKGFVAAGKNSSVETIGDEPFQIYRKFDNIIVAVDEKRVEGIKRLLNYKNPPDLIILDDAFQHRYIKPGLSILLTDYYHLYTSDFPLPSGRLREWRSGAKRADIIIVTKSPGTLSPIIRKDISNKIKPGSHQKLFFSHLKYGDFTNLNGQKLTGKIYFSHILLVAGIANTYPFEEYLRRFCDELEVLRFPDHHNYTKADIKRIIEKFKSVFRKNKTIITTEKDAVRLMQPEFSKLLVSLPLYFVPVEAEFFKEDKQEFNKYISDYVEKNSRNGKIHN